ncbi:hypothetical protein CCAND95_110015 [Capnocytophaga canis]|uniref:Uncharacterized protein n=1 Tax=Capnocytophaga canis TaxID=1848903 RepID=A0A0B7INF7_9FLAO|nr:hypothetical protein CCAND95_110015 [Capnocytophaga canis]CEN46863.1 hypothetical protein CCAND38_380019 [Capnocytophaga canis]CEN53426.1 hypothetical protein CCAND93_430014 [Capnocytophaga canis]
MFFTQTDKSSKKYHSIKHINNSYNILHYKENKTLTKYASGRVALM